MPRVVPSDVVTYIEEAFRHHNPAQVLQQGISAPLASLLAMVDRVPDELLALSGRDFAQFLASAETIRDALTQWRSGSDHARNWQIPYAPVVTIRDLLRQCPDDTTSPQTAALAFVSDVALRESIRLDISGAHRDLTQAEWKGATVLAGSAIEALLLWALQEFEKKKSGSVAAAVAALRPKPLGHDPGADLEGQGWHLHEYVEVAAHLKLIEDDTAKLVRLAKDFRNLIHPGRAARLGQKCDRSTALTALAAVEAVARDLTP